MGYLRPMARSFPTLLLGIALLSDCASRSERLALRRCTFAPRGTARLESKDDSLRLSVALEIRNPGPSAAVLDSFSAEVWARAPLGVLSHGGTFRILPGGVDTVQIHLAVDQSNLMATAAGLLFSPPDSLSAKGTAWIPGWFGTAAHPFLVEVPYSAVANGVKGIFAKGLDRD
jgi:hypothetical protein